MTDTSAQSAVASVVPEPMQNTVAMTDTAVALRAMLHLIGACEFYYAYLAAHILGNVIRTIGEDSPECHYDRLATLEALIVLALIWKESPCITEKDLARAGLRRSSRKGITKHALGRALQESGRRPPTYESPAMFARRAERIVDAAMAYGLVEERECRANYKPLHATERLQDLMAEVGSEVALLLAAFGNKISGPASPPVDGVGGGRS
jgi:hypothetical protein